MIYQPTKILILEIGKATNILPQVIQEIEKMWETGNLKWRDVEDSDFFLNAINKAFLFDDFDSAKELYKIVMKGSNRQFFTDNMSESRFL